MPMKVYWLEWGKFLILAEGRVPSEEEVTELMGVGEGSYGYELAQRVHAALFGHLEDLVETYEKFYEPEFDTLREFLFRKCSLPDEILPDIESSCASGSRLLAGNVDAGGDGGIRHWLRAEYGEELAGKAVRALFFDPNYEYQDEDTY